MNKKKKLKKENTCVFINDCNVPKKNGVCPFQQFNTMSIEEIVAFINEEEGKQASSLMAHYRQCLHIKKYSER